MHSRWRHSYFKPLSERCAVLGIKISKQLKIRAVGVYMPHGGHSDTEVDSLYAELDAECKEAHSKGERVVIAGDFNAEVGGRNEHDNFDVIGDNPCAIRSDRGSMLVQWCTLHKMALSNTFGSPSVEAAWTYRNGDLRKQLDFVLTDMALVKLTLACLVLACVDIGSDHRPVMLELTCCIPKKRRRKKACPKTWRPDSTYVKKVGDCLVEADPIQDVGGKAAFIHDVLTKSLPDGDADIGGLLHRSPADATIHNLIQLRRDLVSATHLTPQQKKQQRVSMGKNIQKLIRKKLADEKTEKIRRVLAEFRDLKQLAAITGKPVNKSIVEVLDHRGNPCRSKAEIAEVFATFYEELYKSRGPAEAHQHLPGGVPPIPTFSLEELQAALKKMRPGKSRDTSGIAAEMLKIDCPILQQMVLDLFNEVCTSHTLPPDWRKSRLVVLFKKGDPKMPGNYRPIAILSLLYKVFSRMLCARLDGTIVGQQSVDQAAYRKGFSTEDHLLSLALLLERSTEWSAEVWLGLVDFEKAFDTVEHSALWEALAELEVSPAYIGLLKTLYSNQVATVSAGIDSRAFALERGVKQGDPISPLLFLAVMEVIFRRLKKKWNKLNVRRRGPYYGIVVDRETDPLSNLRFADDVLLFASAPGDIGKMINDLCLEAAKYGLKLHMGKTVVLTNRGAGRPASINCGAQVVKVVGADDTEKYLGHKLSLSEFHATEFANRMASAWASFFKLKDVLCNRKVPLKDRIKLFECSVTPCALYASGTWATTAEMVRKLSTTRRKMLRWMVGITRQVDEEWVAYIQRATHRSVDLAHAHGAKDWAQLQRQRKWSLAGKAATSNDGRWMSRLLAWTPWFRTTPHRGVGRPVKRWDDDLVRIAGGDWPALARDSAVWEAAAAAYAHGEA